MKSIHASAVPIHANRHPIHAKGRVIHANPNPIHAIRNWIQVPDNLSPRKKLEEAQKYSIIRGKIKIQTSIPTAPNDLEQPKIWTKKKDHKSSKRISRKSPYTNQKLHFLKQSIQSKNLHPHSRNIFH